MMNINENNAAELSYISKWAGCCEDMVQAGGGNTSVKQDDRIMLIKSSGYSLSDVTESEGYSAVDYAMINEYLNSGADDSAEKEILTKSLIDGKRPSIETFLHSMTKKYTIHTHPLCVTMLAVRKNGMDILKQLFPGAVTVGYAVPGLALAKKLSEAAGQNGSADIIFLQNHGLIVSADRAEDAVSLHMEVITKINDHLGLSSESYMMNCRLFEAVHSADKEMIVYCSDNEYVKQALKASGGREWQYRYSPDCIVYCGGKFAVVGTDENAEKRLSEFIGENGMPKVIICGENAFIAAENIKKAKDIESVLSFTAKIYLHEKENDINTLGESETELLLNWDSEKYRRTLKY
ncbi:MAG: class II aldolase/adducin family protein [Oscillospiraceae bacterium]